MSYSLKSFFPKDDDCTIHLLHDKKRSLCFVLHKNQSSLKYVCQIFYILPLYFSKINNRHKLHIYDIIILSKIDSYRISDKRILATIDFYAERSKGSVFYREANESYNHHLWERMILENNSFWFF